MTRAHPLLDAGSSCPPLLPRRLRARLALASLVALLSASAVSADDPAVTQVEVSREQYYEWTFGLSWSKGNYPAKAEARLREELDFVQRACELTDSQRLKLELFPQEGNGVFIIRCDKEGVIFIMGQRADILACEILRQDSNHSHIGEIIQ